MECDDTNKQRGTFMLLALIILLVASFATPEAQAGAPSTDAHIYSGQATLHTGFDKRFGNKDDTTTDTVKTEDDDC